MSANFKCPDVLTGCECLPFPVRNFSAERPDVPVFLSNFPGPTGPWPDAGVPPTGPGFFSPGCLGICTSEISQEDADECAERQAQECAVTTGIPPIQQIYSNAEQTCTVTCPDGTTFGWTIPAGTVQSRWQADANARAYALACKRATANRMCFTTDSALASVCANEFMSVVFDVIGGNEPITFAITSGSVPFGTELNAQGNLFGTPDAAGYHTFTITANDAQGSTQSKEFTLNVVQITSPTALPAGTQNSAYSYALLANGYTGTPTWTLISGALPTGLTRTGAIISGTPTVSGDFNFTMQITDTLGAVCTKAFTLHVDPGTPIVGYWTYDSYDTSGPQDILLDSTPNGHDLIILNPYNVVAGKVGNCMSTFENFCQLASDFSAFDYAVASGFTVCGWIKFDLGQQGQITIWELQLGVRNVNLEFNVDSLRMFASDGREVFAPYPDDGNWHFYRSWVDTDKTLNLQIDLGAKFQSSPIVFSDLACTAFQLQGDTTAIPDTLNGFDETGFWKRVLSDTEAANLWNSGNAITWGNPNMPP